MKENNLEFKTRDKRN